MSFFAPLKQFFGFGPKTVAPKALTSVEEFEARLKATPEAGQKALLVETQALLHKEAEGYASEARGQAGRADEFFGKARAHFNLEVFVYTKMHGQSIATVDPDYELLLRRLVQYAEVFALPATEIINALDHYIQHFEEAIYLAEARGEYKLGLSENGLWIRMPFADPATLKPARRSEAQKQLAGMFKSCSELSLLELELRVPWKPISFIELTSLMKEGRISLLNNPSTGTYYAYLYR